MSVWYDEYWIYCGFHNVFSAIPNNAFICRMQTKWGSMINIKSAKNNKIKKKSPRPDHIHNPLGELKTYESNNNTVL